MTCKDCVHYQMCHSIDLDAPCVAFKNKADFVEVVRCKDCIHYKEKGVGEFDEPLGVCSKDVNFWDDEPREVSSVDFCSDGKKVQE